MQYISKIFIFFSAYVPLCMAYLFSIPFQTSTSPLCKTLQALLALTFIISLSAYLFYWVRHTTRGISEHITIRTSRARSSEALGYLLSYSLPLANAAYKPAASLVVISIVLFLVFMHIYITHNLVYINPTLFLCGYRTYDVSIQNSGKALTILTKEKNIATDSRLSAKAVDSYTYILE